MRVDPLPEPLSKGADGLKTEPVPLPSELVPGLLDQLRVDPGTMVSITHFRAERWTISQSGASVQRLERLQTSAEVREGSDHWSRRARRWPAIGLLLFVPIALIGSFIAGRSHGERPGEKARPTMSVVVPLFDEDVGKRIQSSQNAVLRHQRVTPQPLAAAGPKAAAPVQLSPLTQQSALALAFSTTEPQQWSDEDASGWVVVGPAEQTSDGTCRHVAVLSRIPGAPDQTRNDYRCQSADGQIQIKP